MSIPTGGKGDGRVDGFFEKLKGVVSPKKTEGPSDTRKASKLGGSLHGGGGSNAISAFIKRDEMESSGKGVDAHSPKPSLEAVRKSADPKQELATAEKELKVKSQQLSMKQVQFERLKKIISKDFYRHGGTMQKLAGRQEDDPEVVVEKENREARRKMQLQEKDRIEPELKQLRKEVEALESKIAELRKIVPEDDE